MGTVKDGNVPDAMHECATRAFRECGEQGVPGIAVTAGPLNLDELMVEQGAGRLFGDRIGEALFAEADDRVQWMRQTAQMAALFLR